MSDGFLTLAQAEGGLSCFLVPRWLEEGRNVIHIQRLKDKLGNRANASAEIEYHGAIAHRLGDAGGIAAGRCRTLTATAWPQAWSSPPPKPSGAGPIPLCTIRSPG